MAPLGETKDCFQSLCVFVTFTVYSHSLKDQYVTIPRAALCAGLRASSPLRITITPPGNSPLAEQIFFFFANFAFQITETD